VAGAGGAHVFVNCDHEGWIDAMGFAALHGQLPLTVSDPGGDTVPHLIAPDLERPGALGLFLVKRLSSPWGVQRESDGVVRVRCEIPLEVALRPDR
jgi:hypothetical protein